MVVDALGDLDALPDAVLVLDAGRRITHANAAALRLLGYDRSELAGTSCVERLVARLPDGSAAWADGWDGGTRLRSVRRLAEQTVTLRPRGGPEITVAVTGAYRRDQRGAMAGVVLCLRPAGRAARAEAHHGIAVVATVSHELRSPLTSVKGYTSLMLDRWDRFTDDEKKMMLGQVDRDADRITRLIGELLDVSRLEAGKLALRRRLVDLPALTDTVLGRVGRVYPSLDACTTWPDGMPPVSADPDKIEQIMTNLVENACKYASPRGLRVTGSVTSRDGSAPGATREVAVDVADCGAGIPAADLPRVFDRFFHRSQGRPTGSGLGLWISRGLVEAHGGRLVARSIPGTGSTFCFTLPLVDP